ncbi:MAG: chemotaxis response regulator protein-glutamate methylesterase [Rhodocyclales bacterium]|nr:chemotaxis response regulator protein-glutamate methylesterase [Rhodocyclales bacterium]
MVAIKVLIVDDSALMRALLTEIIGGAPDLQVVGSAPDPIAAREMIKSLNPDVLTLDVEMPKMDGLAFLERLMRLRPMPVVMISSLTERGSEVTLQALEIGAVDFVAKPRAENISLLQAYADEIRDKIRAACGAQLKTRALPLSLRMPLRGEAEVPPSSVRTGLSQRLLAEKLIAIGASTGGTEAIKEVLTGLPEDVPGIVMAQHMPESFTGSFARRLDSLCRVTVVESRGGERIEPGHAYLAPGHSHLLVKRIGSHYVTELSQSDPVNRHRPSVDVLFRSVAEQVKQNAIGVILTGMGKDGALGMLEMRKAGAWNIGQNQESSVVYGMPREAANVGAVEEVAALTDVAARIMTKLQQWDRALR